MPGSGGAPASALAGGAPVTALYIEDNQSNLRLVERVLDRRGNVRLLTATHGREGIELARVHQPDVILLDVHLPDIDGKEVLEQLRRDDATAAIPVAIVSADATRRQMERLREAGAERYLTKPIDVKELLEVIDAAAGGSHEEDTMTIPGNRDRGLDKNDVGN
jgi:CheY-like chemotaxis protein